MINTLKIFDELKEAMDASAAKKITEVIGKVYDELQNTVTKAEFNDLRNIVKELAEAQKRTEQRVEELAEAQKRTEQRVEELVEAQKRTEQKVEELVEAQKRTEQEVRKLTISLKDTRTMVGGLSDTVGYGLEDRAMKSLPTVLKSKYGINVLSPLVRKYVSCNGTQDEINIYGTGKKDEIEICILGEAKARLSKKHVDSFLKLVQRLKNSKVIIENNFLLMVSYTVTPEVEEYAKIKNIVIIWSYEV